MAARRPWRMVTLVAALALAAGACGQDADREAPPQPGPATASSSTSSTPVTSAAPAGPPTQAELDRVAVRLERLARLRNPVALAVAGDGTTLYVGERAGRVRAIRGGRLDPRPPLDLSGEVVVEGEGGLLGVAVAPDGAQLYVSFTDRGHAVRLIEVTSTAAVSTRLRVGTSSPSSSPPPDTTAATSCSAPTGCRGSGSVTAAKAATPMTRPSRWRSCPASCCALTPPPLAARATRCPRPTRSWVARAPGPRSGPMACATVALLVRPGHRRAVDRRRRPVHRRGDRRHRAAPFGGRQLRLEPPRRPTPLQRQPTAACGAAGPRVLPP